MSGRGRASDARRLSTATRTFVQNKVHGFPHWRGVVRAWCSNMQPLSAASARPSDPTIQRRFAIFLGFYIIKDPRDERKFVCSLSSSKIACGVTVLAFLVVRQLLSYAHFDVDSGTIEGCHSQVSHQVSGIIVLGMFLFTVFTWLGRRCDWSPIMQDATLMILLCAMILLSSSTVGTPIAVLHHNHSDHVRRSLEQGLFCSASDVLGIAYNRMIVVCLVIGCGFIRARFSWFGVALWAFVVLPELFMLQIALEGCFDIVVLPLVAWLLAAAFERSRREQWQRAQTINEQLGTISTMSTAQQLERDRNRRLRERQKNQEQFLAAMSHELKTPLAGLIGMLRVAQLDELSQGNPKHVERCVQKALTCGQLLNSLVDDLLDRTRITIGQFCPVPSQVSVVELAESVLELASHLNHLDLELKLDVDGSLDGPHEGRTSSTSQSASQPANICYLDRDRVFQVLLNVVTNSLKFTGPGGRVVVGVALLHTGDGRLTIPEIEGRLQNAANAPMWVQITVTDTGVGIPADQIERCFLPFAKAELAVSSSAELNQHDVAITGGGPKGTSIAGKASSSEEEDSLQGNPQHITGSIGLGLHLCREMCRIMGGTIKLDSKVGEGSTVMITLPTHRTDYFDGGVGANGSGGEQRNDEGEHTSGLVASVPMTVVPSATVLKKQSLTGNGSMSTGAESTQGHLQPAAPERPVRCLVVDDNQFCREVRLSL
jgi:signal transduction histidine kinase